MENKGVEDINTNLEDKSADSNDQNSMKSAQSTPHRVDINVLKSKLQENESREFKKNLFILSSLLIALGALGIYLSI
tara:strand:- start:394 stop:624 length:231 start_codon:yes stop_codon:yes gene_type:complete